jgi:outer membrane protein OmpA-like peptidoglycan-associated protein
MFIASSAARSQVDSLQTVDSTANAEVEEQIMLISVWDSKTKVPLKSDVIIKGLNARKPVVLPHITDTIIQFKSYRQYTISVVSKGYMYFAHKFWPDESASHNEKILLQPLGVGLKTSIEDIYFLGDQTDIYHKSTPALEELLEFMTLNPYVKIKIIGHANGPDTEKKPNSYYRKFSEKRAEAVRDYLIQHGVLPERLATKGAGNSEMIFPNPTTDWETQANRRIEIEVIGL